MKKFKSMVAIITVLCLCTCYIPNAVLTETNMISVNAEDVVTSGKCGENVTWNFDETTGILTIDGTGEMQDFNFYDDVSWKYLRENIKTVIINDGVTSIGNYAFLECSSLESISIPESVIEIGLSAFENCSALQFITIPDSVKEINGSAFENCSALQSIIIPDGVEKIEGGTFEYCSALESIQIPDSVTEIGRDAFAFCLSLESVTISENITEIGSYAFYNSSLQSFIVSENNPNYSSQDGVLFDKNKTTLEIFPARNTMTEYTIPDSVTEISQFAFNNCSVLESLMIS
ncbi:MAG: leucine-rich repeat protein, partial [Oscillospiraceae bacterium]|nr:leucine-rich repeat protein [Oscillospiraceae bacterium]